MKSQTGTCLLELNAFLFLGRLSEKYKKKLSLIQVPQKEWEAIAAQGFNTVWLMGVWKRSPGARQIALQEPNLRKEYNAALPGWKEEDVTGSPYAVYDYSLDPFLGKPEDLTKLKSNLEKSGLKLFLDFVPNHLAFDHPLTRRIPEMFLQGKPGEPDNGLGHFYQTSEGKVLAHGRDPYFPAWSDSVQVNYYSKLYREFAVKTLLEIAAFSDGVRCDMAMLGLHAIFDNTWNSYIRLPRPAQEFWQEIISKVKKKFPKFIFMAEVYWDLEAELQKMGFDFTYDKKLYDRLLQGPTAEIRNHLRHPSVPPETAVHFIENHDEKRAAALFGQEKSWAAAAVVGLLPGISFFYDAQMEGRQIKTPIQLGREAQERPHPNFQKFYEKLLGWRKQEIFQKGQWQFVETREASKGNSSHAHLLVWIWQFKSQRRMVVINYSEERSQGRIPFQSEWLSGRVMVLDDEFGGEIYQRQTTELKEQGLYVDLEAWKMHWLEWEVSKVKN